MSALPRPPPHCKCSALLNELMPHKKQSRRCAQHWTCSSPLSGTAGDAASYDCARNWGARWYSKPRKPEPQSGALPLGHALHEMFGAGRDSRNPNLRFTKPPLCHLSYTGPNLVSVLVPLVSFRVVPEVRLPLLDLGSDLLQDVRRSVNGRR